jgi:hypothetical protein
MIWKEEVGRSSEDGSLMHTLNRKLFRPAVVFYFFLLLLGWDLRHQELRPLLASCTAPDDR